MAAVGDPRMRTPACVAANGGIDGWGFAPASCVCACDDGGGSVALLRSMPLLEPLPLDRRVGGGGTGPLFPRPLAATTGVSCPKGNILACGDCDLPRRCVFEADNSATGLLDPPAADAPAACCGKAPAADMREITECGCCCLIGITALADPITLAMGGLDVLPDIHCVWESD